MNKTYTKKMIECMEKKAIELSPSIYHHDQNLIYMLEMEVRNNIVCYNGVPFQFNDRPIWFHPSTETPNMSLFTPFYNPKLAQILIKHYLILYMQNGGDHVISYYSYSENEYFRAAVQFSSKNNNQYTVISSPYENESTAFVDLIYKLEGCPENFSEIDQLISYMNYKYYMERNAK